MAFYDDAPTNGLTTRKLKTVAVVSTNRLASRNTKSVSNLSAVTFLLAIICLVAAGYFFQSYQYELVVQPDMRYKTADQHYIDHETAATKELLRREQEKHSSFIP